jgi:hypothetical protein
MTRERIIPLAVLGALLTVAACSSDGATSSDTTTATPSTSPGASTTVSASNRPQGFSSRLQFFGDCPALLDYMQTEASERVTAWGLGGGPMMYAEDAAGGRAEAGDTASAESTDAATAPAQTPTPDFSGTNVQEVGVDEGDIVETDGRFVYVAGPDGLRIVSVAEAAVVAEPDLPEGTHQLLLDGTRLLVVTSSWSGAPDTVTSLYDVDDPSAPQLLRRSHLEGNVVATRSIDGVARLVISTSFDQRLPFVQPNQFGLDEESALARNQEIIADSTVEDWLPRWFDEAGDGSFGAMEAVLPCETVAAPADFAGLGITWIGSVDLQGEATPVGSAGVVSTGDTVYASTDNLYIATRSWDWQWGGPVPEPLPMPAVDDAVTEVAPDPGAALGAPEAAPAPDTSAVATTSPDTTTPDTTAATTPDTTASTVPDTTEGTTPPDTTIVDDPDAGPPTLIHQFRLDEGTDATYVASGEVEGRLLNQFAMSEYDGDLRVATTTDDWSFGEQSESTVFVLRPNGDELEQISSVSGLGKGEQIHSVRFIGPTGYVVTFRQIDPLYVLDLSDPEQPVLQGELKIPGYSAYLHPVGDGLLLGVGQDATDDGRTTGTQLSLFDVSDPATPQRISTLAIGGQSEVEWDHRAFLFWQPDGTIVLPVSPGWGDCGPSVDCLAKDITGAGGGAVVAELAGRELRTRGVISHGTDLTGRGGCWNPLQRSIAIGDELVTVGLDQVTFSDRLTLAERDSVSWGDPEEYGCYWYVEG